MPSKGKLQVIFFVTYKWAQKPRALHITKAERLATDKHSSVSGPFVSYDENEALRIRPMANGVSTVVELLTADPEVQGSNPAAAGTRSKWRR